MNGTGSSDVIAAVAAGIADTRIHLADAIRGDQTGDLFTLRRMGRRGEEPSPGSSNVDTAFHGRENEEQEIEVGMGRKAPGRGAPARNRQGTVAGGSDQPGRCHAE